MLRQRARASLGCRCRAASPLAKRARAQALFVDNVLQVATCPNGRKHTEDLREGFFASHRHDERHTAAGQQSCERVPIVAGEAGLNALDEAAGVGNLSE